jgi:dethiobiotin synthetase
VAVACRSADLRIVEGAGGIAVPLDRRRDRDWRDFAEEIAADRVVIVTPDRLGGINQARLALSYAARRRKLPCGIWLNEVTPQVDAIRRSNREALSPRLWATQRFEAPLPEDPEQTRRFLRAASPPRVPN